MIKLEHAQALIKLEAKIRVEAKIKLERAIINLDDEHGQDKTKLGDEQFMSKLERAKIELELEHNEVASEVRWGGGCTTSEQRRLIPQTQRVELG